jgi:hypothetical protein
VLAQAVRLSEAKLRPIFDDSQWRPLSRLIKPLEADLKNQLDRAVFDPDDTAGAIAARPEPSASGKR